MGALRAVRPLALAASLLLVLLSLCVSATVRLPINKQTTVNTLESHNFSRSLSYGTSDTANRGAPPDKPAGGIYLLAMSYPGTWKDINEYLEYSALEAAGNLTEGFLLHGLWPDVTNTSKPSGFAFDATTLPDTMKRDLALFYRNTAAPPGNNAVLDFWAREWEKHGQFSWVPPVQWHEEMLKLAEDNSLKLSKALKSLLPAPGTDATVKVKDIGAALEKVYGPGTVDYPGGIHCSQSYDNITVLSEIRLCVEASQDGTFALGGCAGHSPSAGSGSCGPAKETITVPSYESHRGDFCFAPMDHLEAVTPRSCALGGEYVLSLQYGPTRFPPMDHSALRRLIESRDLTKGFVSGGFWRAHGASDTFPFSCSQEPLKPPGAWTGATELSELANDLCFHIRGSGAAGLSQHVPAWSSVWDEHGRCTGLGQEEYYRVLLIAASSYGSERAIRLLRQQGVDIDPMDASATGVSLGTLKEAIGAAYGTQEILSGPGGIECGEVNGVLVLKEIRLCMVQNPTTGVLSAGKCTRVEIDPEDPPSCGEDDSALIHLPVYSRYNPTGFWEVVNMVALTVLVMVSAVAVMGLTYVLIDFGHVGTSLSSYLVNLKDSSVLFWHTIVSKPLFVPQEPVPVRHPAVHQPFRVVAEKLDLAKLKRDMPELAPYVIDLPVGMGIKGGIARKIVKTAQGNPEPASSFDIDVTIFTNVEPSPEFSMEIREGVTGLKVGDLTIEAQDVEIRAKSTITNYMITRDITQNEVILIKRGPGDALLVYSEDCREDCRLGRATPSVRGLSAGLNMVWEVDERGNCIIAEHIMSRTIIRFLKGHATEYGVDEGTWKHYRHAGFTSITLFKILKHFHADDDKYQAAIDHMVRYGVLSRHTIREMGGANALWGHLIQEVNNAVSRFGGRLKFTDLDPEEVERWLAQKKAKLGDKLVSNAWRARRTGFYPLNEDVISIGLATFPQALLDFEQSGTVYVECNGNNAAEVAAGSSASAVAPLPRAIPRFPIKSSQHRWSSQVAGDAGSPLADASTPLLADSGEPLAQADLVVRTSSATSVNGHMAARVFEQGSAPSSVHRDKLELSFFELANHTVSGDEPGGPQAPSSYSRGSTISRFELMQFVVGVAWPHKWFLLASYGMLLSGLCFRVLASKLEGDALNALQTGEITTFSSCFQMVALVWSASLVTSVAGNGMMQVFARHAMEGLFTKLFSHLIHQDIEMFKHLTVGEVSARCSGDSLNLKSTITFTAFSIVSGALQALIALVMLSISAMELFQYYPLIALAAPVALLTQMGYSVVFGTLVAHPLNHTARRCLGRMYGFLFDTFSQIATVQILGLVHRQTVDYAKFVSDYWHNRLNLDLWLVFEGGFTSAVGVVLTLTFLYSLGHAYFAKAVFGIGTIYSVLRFVQLMQLGVKSASDGCARLAASLGSVERLVELHNHGRLHSDLSGRHMSCEESVDVQPGVPPTPRITIGALTGSFRLVGCSCSYAYKSDTVVLRDISIEVPAGAAMAVNGESGSGKSSILRTAYLRLLPFKGHVEFQAAGADGAPRWVAFSNLHHGTGDIQDQMAVCSLETMGTFFASVETNVACAAGDLEVSSDEVREACRLVGLDDLVYNKLNDGYFTPIGGPSGVALNNDLLVRLSLARAVIRKPKICFLDETDHFAYVVGIPLLKRFLAKLTSDGCAVLMSVWNQELGKELVIPPPGNLRMRLMHFLRAGKLT